jgi:hypothetical protein
VPTLNGNIDVLANDNFPALSRLQIDLLVGALACDATRVASLQYARGLAPTRFSWLGIGEEHHELSHAGDSDDVANDKLTQINAWYAGELAYLLTKLASVPEGDGTLLDNCMVVWGNELAKGNAHNHYPVPFVIAGGAGGYLDPGRVVDCGDTPHNRLLVSICHAMGLTGVQSYGDMDTGTGPLPGLT